MKLPPLPEPGYWSTRDDDTPLFTSEQMRDYARAALAAVPAQPVLDCEIQPRPLSYPLTDYHSAGIDGPLHYTWKDKPHRLLYDLIAAVRYYAAPQAVPVPADMALTDDPWRKLYRRAINEANGLTNYVEDRPELRGAERRLAAIEAEARTLAATFEPTPEKKP